jgi:hypothetical protein
MPIRRIREQFNKKNEKMRARGTVKKKGDGQKGRKRER